VKYLVRVVALLGIVALPVAAHAQPSWGFRVGVNLSDLTPEPALPDFDVEGVSRGLVAGGFVTLPVNSLLAFQPEALYSRQGAKFTDMPGETKLDYIQVPLLARVRTGARSPLAVLFGPSLGVLTGVSRQGSGFVDVASSALTVDDLFRRFDLGLVAGAGLDVGHLVFDGRYTWGVTNIWNDTFHGMPLGGNQKNRVFALSAGLRIK
jgi:Outer membrane protein beta-barrel domain